MEVNCHSFHCDLWLTIYSSELSTFHYHLSHLFHNSTSCLEQHISPVQSNLNRAEPWALDGMRHWLLHRSNVDNCLSTMILQLQPPTIWHRPYDNERYVKPDAGWVGSSLGLDMSSSILVSQAVNEQYTGRLVYIESDMTKLPLSATGTNHGWHEHLSSQFAKWNIRMSSALLYGVRNLSIDLKLTDSR